MCSEDWQRGCQSDVMRQTVPSMCSSNWKCPVIDSGKAGAADRQSMKMMQIIVDGESGDWLQASEFSISWKFISEVGESQSIQKFVSKDGQYQKTRVKKQ